MPNRDKTNGKTVMEANKSRKKPNAKSNLRNTRKLTRRIGLRLTKKGE